MLIDNLAALRSEFDDVAGMELMDELSPRLRRRPAGRHPPRRHRRPPEHRPDRLDGGHDAEVALPARRPLRLRLARADRQGRAAGDARPRRDGRNGLHIQLGEPLPSLDEAAAAVAGALRRSTPVAAPIGVLPTEVALASLDVTAHVDEEPWRIGIGMRESDLERRRARALRGRARDRGRARRAAARAWRCGRSPRRWPAPAPATSPPSAGRRSPLRDCPALDRFAGAGGDASALLAQLRTHQGPVVLLIDDAEGFDDADGAIAGLLGAGRPDLHVVAAARADSLRSLYSHWTQEIRRSKIGLLLRPDIDYDGDLVGTTLPRRAPVQMAAGRGYLSHNGEFEIVQVASPR